MPPEVLVFVCWQMIVFYLILCGADVVAAMVVADVNDCDESDARDDLIQRTLGLRPSWNDTGARPPPPPQTRLGWVAANLFGC